ncbi:MAG: dephospho-CoA kinase [Nitrospiraceae bacterium]|nr:dephospho-CoA kinase [Nitrospiraceae bacterium]
MSRVIGLTGGIAAGKSHVASAFVRKSIPVVSADLLAREVVQPGSEGLRAVSMAFPDSISPDGTINRQLLGRKIFHDPESRRVLEGILHPLIRQLFISRKQLLSNNYPVFVYEVPLLFESGADKEVDMCVVVDVPEALQLSRLMERDGLSEKEALLRIKSQLSREKRLELADRVIEGNLSRESLDARIDDILREVLLKK